MKHSKKSCSFICLMNFVFLSLALLTFSERVNGQDYRCAGLQSNLEKVEKQEAQLSVRKAALAEFFSLMENPGSALINLDDELATAEYQIKAFQRKIDGGDNSADNAAELQTLRTRAELMKLRMSKNFNENSFFNQPKYRELEKRLNNLKNTQTDLKAEIAGLRQEMSERKCPRVSQRTSDDDGEISTDLGDNDTTDDSTKTTGQDKKTNVQAINPSDSADHLRGRNGERFTFSCPSDGGWGYGAWRVVGDEIYRDDSAICVAAIHAGLITSAAGGTVTIEMRPGLKQYAGSSRNGVKSKPLGDGKGSFVFIR